MIHLITGGAGCIGSELVGALLARGETVRVLDNLSSGRIEHLHRYMADARFRFINGDVGAYLEVEPCTQDVDMVWHLTAKTDIKNLDPANYDFEADYEQNLEATWTLLQAMRENGVKRLAFSSSAAVYGDPGDYSHRPNASISGRTYCDWCGLYSEKWKAGVPCAKAPMPTITETMRLDPISMYGATKLACEAIIRALALRTGMQAWIFRYCSIVSGKARTSGNMVIPDLIHKLRKDPTRLDIYGDGNQTKPSLHVSECVDAMLYAVEHAQEPVNLFNVGAPDAISVTRQAELICEAMGVQPKFEYTGGAGGWPGDVPSFRMCVAKLANLGWKAKMTSEEAVRLAIQGLLESGE